MTTPTTTAQRTVPCLDWGTSWQDDCGCMLHDHGTRRHIHQCPTHAAAPALLAALEEALPALKGTEYASQMVKDRYARAAAAIRQARGEG